MSATSTRVRARGTVILATLAAVIPAAASIGGCQSCLDEQDRSKAAGADSSLQPLVPPSSMRQGGLPRPTEMRYFRDSGAESDPTPAH